MNLMIIQKRLTIRLRLLLLLLFPLGLIAVSPQRSQRPVVGLADTAWPMYQHDAHHTGRSTLDGPESVVPIWTYTLPYCDGKSGEMVIAEDGSILLSYLIVRKFDPKIRDLVWITLGKVGGTPVVANDSGYFWGRELGFGRFFPDGSVDWEVALNSDLTARSSPVIGLDGNLYYIHDGLWSFTPDGDLRWVDYWGLLDPRDGNLSVGKDGTIYAGGCAYSPDGTFHWCFSLASDLLQDFSIAEDGSIYALFLDGRLYSINTSNTVNWSLQLRPIYSGPSQYSNGDLLLPNGEGVSRISSAGSQLWYHSYPQNSISGGKAGPSSPATIDNRDNAYFCLGNSHCYGISSDGSILWDYSFTPRDSIGIGAMQPLIYENGLIFLADSSCTITALADPEMFPVFSATPAKLEFISEPGGAKQSAIVEIGTSIGVEEYFVIAEGATWLSTTTNSAMTPGTLQVSVDPSGLAQGIYTATVSVRPLDRITNWLEIPVILKVGLKTVFLPVFAGRQTTDQIVFFSDYFNDKQIARIDEDGEFRSVAVKNRPFTAYGIAYSPKGDAIAVEEYKNNHYRIIIMDTTNGRIISTFEGERNFQSPTWSPDGSRIAFLSSLEDASQLDIYVANRDGSSIQRVINEEFSIYDSPIYWSPIGDRIAYKPTGASTCYANLAGTERICIPSTGLLNTPMGWSPDGQSLLVFGFGDYEISNPLIRYDIIDQSKTVLAYHTRDESGDAAWSPDGSRIAFIGRGSGSNWDIFIVNRDGTGVINLTQDINEEHSLSWSWDGQWILFSRQPGGTYEDPNYDIYKTRADGTELIQLTKNIKGDWFPAWLLPWK